MWDTNNLGGRGDCHRKSDKTTFRLDIRKKIFTVKVVKHHQKVPIDLQPVPPESGVKGLPADRFTPPYSIE